MRAFDGSEQLQKREGHFLKSAFEGPGLGTVEARRLTVGWDCVRAQTRAQGHAQDCSPEEETPTSLAARRMKGSKD